MVHRLKVTKSGDEAYQCLGLLLEISNELNVCIDLVVNHKILVTMLKDYIEKWLALIDNTIGL